MTLAWTGSSPAFNWLKRIPWYEEWHRSLYDIGTITIEHARLRRSWYVRILKGDSKCIGTAKNADPIEAFRIAGGRALAWRLEESARRRKAHARGLAHEKRLCILLEHLPPEQKPDWFGTVRIATSQEDRRGIDVVVQTDAGEIGLQSKSSFKKMDDFKAAPGHEGIRCVLVNEKRTDAQIIFFALRAIQESRDERLGVAQTDRTDAPVAEDDSSP